MATSVLRQQLLFELSTIENDALEEIARFVATLRSRKGQPLAQDPPRPVALGGIWKGHTTTEEDLQEIRQEMWRGFGDDYQTT